MLDKWMIDAFGYIGLVAASLATIMLILLVYSLFSALFGDKDNG